MQMNFIVHIYRLTVNKWKSFIFRIKKFDNFLQSFHKLPRDKHHQIIRRVGTKVYLITFDYLRSKLKLKLQIIKTLSLAFGHI